MWSPVAVGAHKRTKVNAHAFHQAIQASDYDALNSSRGRRESERCCGYIAELFIGLPIGRLRTRRSYSGKTQRHFSVSGGVHGVDGGVSMGASWARGSVKGVKKVMFATASKKGKVQVYTYTFMFTLFTRFFMVHTLGRMYVLRLYALFYS